VGPVRRGGFRKRKRADPGRSPLVDQRDVRNDPDGANPHGQISFQRFDIVLAGPLRCLEVSGNTAVVGFTDEMFDFIAVAIDNRPAGTTAEPADEFLAARAPTSPIDCAGGTTVATRRRAARGRRPCRHRCTAAAHLEGAVQARGLAHVPGLQEPGGLRELLARRLIRGCTVVHGPQDRLLRRWVPVPSPMSSGGRGSPTL
jgi:hypothetical protein